MSSASNQPAPLRRRGPTESTAQRWDLAALEAWARAPRAERAAVTPPTLDEALEASEQIVGLARAEPTRALHLSTLFVEAARASRHPAVLAVARRCRGHMFRRLGRYREALRDYESARAALGRLGMALEGARTAIGMVDALGHMGRNSDARRLATRARAVFLRAGEPARAARLDVNLGILSERSGRPREALAAYRRAESIFERRNDATDLALTRFNHANALVSLDRYEEALALYRSSADVWRSRGATTTLGRCQLAIGSVLFRLGRLDEAVELLEETSALAATLDDPELTATASLDQARAELLMGRLDTAGPRLDAAIAGFESLAMHADRAEALGLRATLRWKSGRSEEALGDWNRAGDIYRGIGHRGGMAWTDFWRAGALARLDRAAESRALLRASLRSLQRSGSAIGELEARLLLAEQELERRPREANRHLAVVARRARTLQDPWIDYRLSIARALWARRIGSPRAAREALERAYAGARRLQALLPLEAWRARWLGRRDELFDLALDARLEGGTRWQFLWSERARAPRAALGRPAAGAGGGIDEDLRAFEASREELHWLDAGERARRFADPGSEREGSGSGAGARDLAAWRRKRAQALARLERHGKRLEIRVARRGGAGAYTEPDPVAIQAALASDEALLEFLVRDGELLTFVVSRGGMEVVAMSREFDEAREAAVRLRQIWERYRLGPGFIRRHEETLTATTSLLLDRLRDIVLDPARTRVPPGVRRLVVSPHAWLRSVPFHVLAGDEWDVRYALSGQSLAASSGSPGGRAARANGRALVVGVATEDAPGAEREARAVAREHPRSTLLLGDQATPDAVRAHWPRARIIHVAAHGTLQTADPRLSGLPLAGGTWSVHDLREVETRADLVVLSSCQSGETVLWGSDHQIGLLPALFERGARSAIVSLWPADDDSTGILMSAFHHELSAGRGPGRALQSARRVVRGVKPAPYYWAPFVLYGADHRGGPDHETKAEPARSTRRRAPRAAPGRDHSTGLREKRSAAAADADRDRIEGGLERRLARQGDRPRRGGPDARERRGVERLPVPEEPEFGEHPFAPGGRFVPGRDVLPRPLEGRSRSRPTDVYPQRRRDVGRAAQPNLDAGGRPRRPPLRRQPLVAFERGLPQPARDREGGDSGGEDGHGGGGRDHRHPRHGDRHPASPLRHEPRPLQACAELHRLPAGGGRHGRGERSGRGRRRRRG
jgi:tetratricopeptide (TPR) repeat protein